LAASRSGKNSSLAPRTFFIVTVGLAAVIFAPMYYRLLPSSDYYIHAMLAARMAESASILTPHFLYQLILIPLATLLAGNFAIAGLFATTLFTMTTAGILWNFLHKLTTASAATFLTIALLLVGPVLLIAPLDGHYYSGYIGINVFHNPTMLLLKPLAVVSFYYAAIYSRGEQSTPKHIALSGLITILAALAKPNFTICIIPALLVMTALLLKRGNKPDWRMLIGGFLLPAAGVLLVQYLLAYSTAQIDVVNEGKSSIILAPFAVMKGFSSYFILKFFCSFLFPLGVALNFPSLVKRDAGLLLAWFSFLFGAAYTYLLAESGSRMTHGNFVWSGQITLFILFIMSTLFLLRQAASAGGWVDSLRHDRKFLVSSILFSMHLASGLVFYALEYLQPFDCW